MRPTHPRLPFPLLWRLFDFVHPCPLPAPLVPYTTLFRSTITAVGVARPSASGHAITTAVTANVSARSNGSRATKSQIRNVRSEEHTSELQSLRHLVCRLLLEKKKASVPHGTAML